MEHSFPYININVSIKYNILFLLLKPIFNLTSSIKWTFLVLKGALNRMFLSLFKGSIK